MATCDAGVYGLAVMGLNLSLNICSRGFRVCVCNRTIPKIDIAVQQAQKEGLASNYVATKNTEDFVRALKKPRRIIMMIQAGAPVDALISHLLPFLDKGDCLVDGGNEFFENTERREKECAAHGILYMGLGVSGGEEGARYGPSLMPGGSAAAWELMRPILIRIAAKINDPHKGLQQQQQQQHAATAAQKEAKAAAAAAGGGRGGGGTDAAAAAAAGTEAAAAAAGTEAAAAAAATATAGVLAVITEEEIKNACVTYIGPGGAGHYVKMVHNGIEYGDMQLIAEAYHLLKYTCNFTNSEIRDLFVSWNQKGELQSYLIEITADILVKKDPLSNEYLLDQILDTAGSKGTGKWTVQQAAEAGVAIPTIATALDIRYLSDNKQLREMLNTKFQTYHQHSQGQGGKPDAAAAAAAATNAEESPRKKNKKSSAANKKEAEIADIEKALLCGKICCYAQGMQLLATVSKMKNWNLNLAEICRIWKGGCIIRAKFLDTLAAAFNKNPSLQNVLLDDQIAKMVKDRLPALQRTVASAILPPAAAVTATAGKEEEKDGDKEKEREKEEEHGFFASSKRSCLTVACHSASLSYLTAISAPELPTNLIQAQRDCFGAHTFKRKDRDGIFHEEHWLIS